MGVDLETWVDCMKRYPAKYKFKGLLGWHTNVLEACVHDEKFMDKYMEEERSSVIAALDKELARKLPDVETNSDDPYVESYAHFLRRKFWSKWEELENINHAPARKVIRVLDPFMNKMKREELWEEWAEGHCDPQLSWETILQDEQEYYLKEHPPTHMLDHASDLPVPIEDILFICPACGRHPVQKEAWGKDGYYCGMCGASSNLSEGETLEQWAETMGLKLWPFKEAG